MNYFCEHNLERKAGSKEISTFFDYLCQYTITYLKKYYDNFPKELKEHGFEYGEQQLKTFLTLSLGKLTNHYFIQESPIDKKYFDSKHKTHSTSYGRTDYWATYKNSSFLIEVKNGWIRYHSKFNDFTFYSYLTSLLNKSMEQINDVDSKMIYKYSLRLFGLGLVVAPIFYNVKISDEIPVLILDNKIRDTLTYNAFKMGSNICSFWKLPENYIKPPEIYDNKKFGILALAFIGRYKKFTKK